jgi:peptide chain release factor subunit 1
MASTVTLDGLRDLAAFRAQAGCAVSLYVNLDPSVAPTAGDAATRMNSLLADAEKQVASAKDALSHEQYSALRDDLERISSYFANDFDRDGSHGLAVFSSSLDGLWRVVDLPAAPEDAVRIERELYLAPLIRVCDGGGREFVAVVSREQGRVYTVRGGGLQEVVDQHDDVPAQHDQGGWSQARYERHIDKLVFEHLKAVADHLDRLVRRAADARIVLVCTEELRTDVEAAVANETRPAIVGWTTAEAHAAPAELYDATRPIFEEAEAQAEEDVLARWREEAAKGGRAASGWEQTLEAASDGRVDVLLMHEGADREAWECPRCGRAAAADGSCPLDGTKLERRESGLDLAVRQTLAHGGAILAIRHQRDLEPLEGLAALLRF